MDDSVGRLDRAIKAAGVAIRGVSPDASAPGGYRVSPPELQSAAQPTIDAFNPDDPSHRDAELTAAVTHCIDEERIYSAIVWTILKQMFSADTDAQTRTKYGVARGRIIDTYKSQIWKP